MNCAGALSAKFPGQVDSSGSIALRVNASSARVDADVVPCYSIVYGLSGALKLDHVAKSISIGFLPAFGFALLIDAYLWRWRIFRIITGVDVPCLVGRWTGSIRSTYSSHAVDHPIVLEIWQRMTAIDVWYFDENAVTRTLVADIVRTSEKGPVKLYILYRNEPITNQFTGFNSHTGVMDLVVDEARKRIAGIYFNNPHERATYGELRVEYSGPRRFGSFKRE